MLLAVEKDVFEGKARFLSVLVRVSPEVGFEFLFVRRTTSRRQVFAQEFKLLSHAAPDDDVVLIQPHGFRFTIEHFFANVVVDQPLHFFLGRRAHPGSTETDDDAFDLALGNNDLLPGADTYAARPPSNEKDHRPQQEEVKQRLADQLSQGRPHRLTSPGCTRSAKCRRALALSSSLQAAS